MIAIVATIATAAAIIAAIVIETSGTSPLVSSDDSRLSIDEHSTIERRPSLKALIWSEGRRDNRFISGSCGIEGVNRYLGPFTSKTLLGFQTRLLSTLTLAILLLALAGTYAIDDLHPLHI